MGESSSASTQDDDQELRQFRNLLWGQNIKLDVFRRWSQGFEFSEVEPSALVQRQGGPCAVIAPVQAYLLKILMDTPNHCLKDMTNEKCKQVLIQALCNILEKCSDTKFRIVSLHEEAVEAMESSTSAATDDDGNVNTSADTDDAPEAAHERLPEDFHNSLSVINLETIDDVSKYLTENFRTLTADYGVLLFMYSVLMTKGFESVTCELSDTSEPLIHNTYGYGSQGLINLMLTGQAVAHVWDHEEDIGGLKLRGISQQSEIGFITLMEQMRYCTVGSFYKNPKNPVWVMGSETHLTVLFSHEKRLVSPETSSEVARRVFKSYDPEGNNFIPAPVLQDVLASLDLVSEPEYVEIMVKKLDPENLGIILLNAFMDEFFPVEKRSTPDTFDLLHYNGIPGSNEGNKVRFSRGSAVMLECDLKSVCVSNPMLTCLQTKWPNIDVNWNGSKAPSLN